MFQVYLQFVSHNVVDNVNIRHNATNNQNCILYDENNVKLS